MQHLHGTHGNGVSKEGGKLHLDWRLGNTSHYFGVCSDGYGNIHMKREDLWLMLECAREVYGSGSGLVWLDMAIYELN